MKTLHITISHPSRDMDRMVKFRCRCLHLCLCLSVFVSVLWIGRQVKLLGL